MFVQGHKPSHKGKSTTTDPLKDIRSVELVKAHLKGNIRDYALWVTAINSALRAGDLCRLKWIDTIDDGERITLRLTERKTGKPRTIPLNEAASSALRAWRFLCEHEHIYSGQRGALTVATWGRMVKGWCNAAGLDGNFASHTCRKTFVRVQLDEFGTSLHTLMHVLNHSTERQTLTYAGKLGDDVLKAYGNAL